jgi:hypothetical protein
MTTLRKRDLDRLIAASGRIQSGQIANRNTRLTNRKMHVRVMGEGKTLCGKPLGLWQFCQTGNMPGGHVPSADWLLDDHNGCASCRAHPIVKATVVIQEARRSVLGA